MALSASYDFALDRDGIITRALLIIGAVGAGQTPTASEITDGGETLNLMLKAWQADGLQLFTLTNISLTPVLDQYQYTFGPSGDIDTGATGPRPEEIFNVHRRLTSDTTDIELTRLSRQEYWQLPNKSSSGTPTQFYYDPAIVSDLAKLYVWPAPDATFVADQTLEIKYQKPFDDMDAATNDLAFPNSWTLAIVFGLAELLAFEYGLPTGDIQHISQRAMIEKDRVMSWDREHTSVFFQPEPRWY
jgi:hypothetical protein